MNLEREFTFENWIDLAEPTLTSAQLFDRHRAGEIERIEISDLEVRQKLDEKTMTYFQLSRQP